MGIGDWGLANPQSPIPNPQFKEINSIIIKLIVMISKTFLLSKIIYLINNIIILNCYNLKW